MFVLEYMGGRGRFVMGVELGQREVLEVVQRVGDGVRGRARER